MYLCTLDVTAMKKSLIIVYTFFCLPAIAQNVNPTQLLEDVEILSSDVYKGRQTGTIENQMAANYIIGRFKKIGVSPFRGTFKQSFTFKSKLAKTIYGNNIIGQIPGKTNDVIVISAHYDHVGIKNGLIYNGADDNASGIGGLLAIASYYQKNKPKHTLIFAAFDAEEMGLEGAKAFVSNSKNQLSKVKMNINMDMISHNDKGELYVCGTFLYPYLKKYLITTNPNLKLLAGHDDPKLGKDDDWTNQSDQGAFNAKKIPFLYFGVEDHKDYHKSTDEYSNINKTFYIDAANAILEVVENIDKDKNIATIFNKNLIMKN